MIFHHNFDLGNFHLHKNNEDGTAYFYKGESFDISDRCNWRTEYRLYPWNQMITEDGHRMNFCKDTKKLFIILYPR